MENLSADRQTILRGGNFQTKKIGSSAGLFNGSGIHVAHCNTAKGLEYKLQASGRSHFLLINSGNEARILLRNGNSMIDYLSLK